MNNRRQRTALLVFTLAVCSCLALSAAAAPPPGYYVCPTGRDGNDGLSPATPFQTLEKAQAAMRGSAIKTVYLMKGTFPVIKTLTLTAADNGETWRNYPPDGVNQAVLDGGSTAPDTGVDVLTILGGSKITIDGLAIQNHRSWGVGIHGGVADPPGGFPVATTTADGNTIVNNVIQNGWTTYNGGWAGGGIWAQGEVTNLTVTNNAIQHQYGAGIRLGSNGDGVGPRDTIAGYRVENNVILNTDINTGDNGAIYVQDVNFGAADPAGSRRSTVKNNYIRDYQGKNGIGNGAPCNMAIYFDCGASNADIMGNIIAPTANVITDRASSTIAIWVGGGHHVTVSGNIVDLGRTAHVLNMGYAYTTGPGQTSKTVMTNNSVTGNIFLGNWAGPQVSGYFGAEQIAFALGEPIPAIAERPTVAHNVYYNYGSGALATHGNCFGDAGPISVDPRIVGWEYAIAPDSPVYKSPINFPPIVGGWGPPGYAIPHTGTAPSFER